MAAIAHAATLESRVPFVHFFDGFRTSHEVAKVTALGDEILKALIDERAVLAHRGRALSPEHPVVRGTAQNPDVYLQAREAANAYYFRCPEIVQAVMRRFAAFACTTDSHTRSAFTRPPNTSSRTSTAPSFWFSLLTTSSCIGESCQSQVFCLMS